MERRRFLAGTFAAGAGLVLGSRLTAADPKPLLPKGGSKMPFQQPPLPFAKTALAPFLSEEQLNYHYDKHHAAYFKNLNGLVDGKPEASLSLQELVVQAAAGPVFNNAAQALNHSFYWDCMMPHGGGQPKGDLAAAIKRDYNSFEDFKKAITDATVKVFGSGWGWLACDKQGKLEIMALGNADTPLKHGKEPLLTIDVWEHAYYVDYRNERPRYVDGYWNVVNWEFAEKCFQAAIK